MPPPTKPPRTQPNPLGPPGFSPLLFEGFTGLETSASRPGLKDDQCYIMDGWFPFGPNNLRTMWGIGTAIFTPSSNASVVFFDFANFGATPVMIAVLSDGSIWQVNTATMAVTEVASPGTIQTPNRSLVGVTQWGSQYVAIVASQTNGFWVWDGTNFFTAGTLGPDVTMLNSGLDYTSQPDISAFGGNGSGATFIATLLDGIVQSVTVTNPGLGYISTDAAILAFSGGGSSGITALATGNISGGTLSSVSITNPGAGYTTAVTGTVIGGGGAGALVSVHAAGGTISNVSVSFAGAGYVSSPVINFIDPNNPVAQATVDLMPFGIEGTAAEVYQSRIWVANGAMILFSAPASLVNFSTAAGGGEFQSVDSFLRVGFTQLKQTSGFLYLIADSSINYLSGVQTSGTPPETTFTNQNADPEIGTPWPGTVDVFSRNILFANAFGVHVSYGGAVSKISDPLDGIYASVQNLGGFTPSAGKAIIFGKKCWMLLLPAIDQVTSQQVNKLFVWNGKTWCSTQQDVALIYIQHQEINSILTCYGTDGNSVYPLFQQPSINFTKTVQSKLWARPGYMFTKTVNRLWGMGYYYSALSPDLTISIDNEFAGSSSTYGFGPNVVSVINEFGAPVSVINESSEPVTVVTSTGVVVFAPQAVGQNGALLGMTVSTSAADMALISFAMDGPENSYRG